MILTLHFDILETLQPYWGAYFGNVSSNLIVRAKLLNLSAIRLTEYIIMKNINQIIDLLNDLDTDELIQVNNSFAIENDYCSEVYINDEEFFETYFLKSIDAVRAVSYGNYNYSHDYVRINGYGNLESFDCFEVSDICDTVENIAEHIAENEELYDFLDLSDIDEEDDED